MESIITGIVVKRTDIDDFDQIVTLITPDEVISFIALGVRKITSKNRVALQLGNVIEAEIFRARLNGKLSKLKRAVLIKQVDIKESDNANVLLEMIKYLSKIKKSNITLFSSIVKSLDTLGKDFNHQVKTFLVAALLESFGLKQNYSCCVECGRKDLIDDFRFFKGGFLCKHHVYKNRTLEELKAFKNLKDLDKYKDTDPVINKKIFKELTLFIKDNEFI